MSQPTPITEFDAARNVFEQLKDLERERQERVLRWVAEILGISLVAPAVTAPPSAQGSTPTPPDPAGGPTPGSPGGVRDIRSFVAEKAPKSENQFAAVVAYYYCFEAPEAQRKTGIGGSDLQEAARLAGRKRLSNPRQTLKNAKSMGYLDSKGPGEYTINTVGENLVAMTLPGGEEVKPLRAKRAKATGTRAHKGGRARKVGRR